MKYKDNKYMERLRTIRLTKNIKQIELANHLKITQEQYSLYETGKRKMPFDTYIQIAIYLNVSLDYLSGIKKEPTKI